jgi:CHAT domain-containing protein
LLTLRETGQRFALRVGKFRASGCFVAQLYVSDCVTFFILLLLAKSFLSALFLLLFFTAVAQQPEVPLWKMYYDSASHYLNKSPLVALDLLASAEKVARDDLGIYDDNYLVILNSFGLAYSYAGDNRLAEQHLRRAVVLAQEVDNSNGDRVLRSKLNLANVMSAGGGRRESLQIFAESFNQSFKREQYELYAMSASGALRILEGDHQLDTALALVKRVRQSISLKEAPAAANEFDLALGRILRKMRKFDTADSVLKLIDQRLSVAGTQFRSLRQATLLQLRLVEIETGNYVKAEKNLQDFYRIVKNESETDPTIVIETANALAHVYEKLGVFSKAVNYYNEALDWCEIGMGECDIIQNNISGLYLKQGRSGEAIAHYERYVASFEGMPKKELNRNYLMALNNLSTAYRQNGQYDQAIAGLEYVNASLAGEDLSDFGATVKANLGVTFALTGEFDKACNYFVEALTTKEKIFGRNSSLLLDLTSNYATALWLAGKRRESLPVFQRSLDLSMREVKYNFDNLTESEQVEFYEKQKETFERFNTLAVQSTENANELLVQMFNNQLLLKSIIFFTNRKINDVLRNSRDPVLIKAIEEKQKKLGELGHYYQLSLDELARQRVSLPAIETQVDSLDKYIRHRLRADEGDGGDVAWKDVQASLGQHEASVDIIRFRKYETRIDRSSVKKVRVGFSDSIHYAALITTAETKSSPRLILLKNGDWLETRYLNYYRNTTRFEMEDTVSFQQFWTRIESELTGKTKIYMTPDGVFRQINLHTMRSASGNYVIEDYQIHTLLNPAAVAARSDTPTDKPETLVLMGNPSFPSEHLGEQTQWKQLPGTQQEVTEIEKLFSGTSKVTLYTKHQASEKNLRAVKSPSILHIASHGFFAGDFAYINDQVKSSSLFNSGLVLSGDGGVQTQTTESDGIVTAYDIFNLDLANTDLVVLSACETGLGRNEFGEGVYGLQRSFMQAGAKDVVISLWKVDDKLTKDLMVAFYSKLRQTNDAFQAMRSAQLELIKRKLPPRLWGAFIIVSSK